jgi:subtilase family serine protease
MSSPNAVISKLRKLYLRQVEIFSIRTNNFRIIKPDNIKLFPDMISNSFLSKILYRTAADTEHSLQIVHHTTENADFAKIVIKANNFYLKILIFRFFDTEFFAL